uniref:Uncharacterized protein n=1 Tax=viral metagenome TaxID=1070528 RepID=A0A6C0C7Z4_9ZZZZ
MDLNNEQILAFESYMHDNHNNKERMAGILNATRLSTLETLICPDNVYFDVPISDKYLDFVMNATKVYFDDDVELNDSFYKYLRYCNNKTIGFRQHERTNIPLIFSETITTALISEYWNQIIKSPSLLILALGCTETREISTTLLIDTLPSSVKILMLNQFAVSPVYNKLDKLILGGIFPDEVIRNEYYLNSLKEIVLIPERIEPEPLRGTSECKCVIDVHPAYKDKVTLLIPDDYEYECLLYTKY